MLCLTLTSVGLFLVRRPTPGRTNLILLFGQHATPLLLVLPRLVTRACAAAASAADAAVIGGEMRKKDRRWMLEARTGYRRSLANHMFANSQAVLCRTVGCVVEVPCNLRKCRCKRQACTCTRARKLQLNRQPGAPSLSNSTCAR